MVAINTDKQNSITVEEVLLKMNYDPDTGHFTWRKKAKSSKGGKIVGTQYNNQYWMIPINKKQFLAHRLAWFVYYGSWPKNGIDHINGDKLDNRIENLRDIEHKHNVRNRRRMNVNNTSGYRGVVKQPKSAGWKAQIRIHGKNVYLGTRATKEEAYALVTEALFTEYKEVDYTRGTN